jgi:hypothetical protein
MICGKLPAGAQQARIQARYLSVELETVREVTNTARKNSQIPQDP